MPSKKVKKSGLSPDKNQLDSLKEQLARSQADYVNLEKRIETQRQMLVVLATTAIVSKMVEVLDDFHLAQSHLRDEGLQIAIDKFKAVLKSEGVEEIKAEGEVFDPVTMDCVEVAAGPQDHVVEVRKAGYKLADQVIRPAQVVVGKDTGSN